MFCKLLFIKKTKQTNNQKTLKNKQTKTKPKNQTNKKQTKKRNKEQNFNLTIGLYPTEKLLPKTVRTNYVYLSLKGTHVHV